MNETQRAIKLLAEANEMTVIESIKDISDRWSFYCEKNPMESAARLLPYCVYAATGRIICYAPCKDTARKISALPDLLEAAEAAVRLLGSMSGSSIVQVLLKDAIAKAKGAENGCRI